MEQIIKLTEAICHVTFLPVWILAVVGVVIAAIRFRSASIQKRVLYFPLWASIVLMLGWRLFVPLASSRYVDILLIATLILAAYAVVHMSGGLLLFRNTKFLARRVFLCGTLILLLGCVMKCLRFNPYGNAVSELSQIIQRDAKQFRRPMLFVAGTEMSRFKYYAGIAAGVAISPQKDANPSRLRQLLTRYQSGSDAVYVLLSTDTPDRWSAETMNLSPLRWTWLGSRVRSPRRKAQWVVFRYLPPAEESRIVSPAEQKRIALEMRNELVPNGDFEISNPTGWNSFTERFAAAGMPFFQKTHQYPRDWFPSGMGFSTHPDGEIEFAGPPRALQGKYSLRMFSRRLISITNQRLCPAGKYTLSFLVKGKAGSSFYITILRYNREGKFIEAKIEREIMLETSDALYITIPNDTNGWQPDRIRWSFGLKNGEIILDEIALQKKTHWDTPPSAPQKPPVKTGVSR